MAKRLPAWLKERLGPSRGRQASPAKCRACGAGILAGLDGDVAALAAEVDPEPLTAFGEAMAVVLDWPTYELRALGRGLALYRRDRWQQRGRKPGEASYGRKFDVVAQHRCGAPVPFPGLPSVHKPQPKTAGPGAEPPF